MVIFHNTITFKNGINIELTSQQHMAEVALINLKISTATIVSAIS